MRTNVSMGDLVVAIPLVSCYFFHTFSFFYILFHRLILVLEDTFEGHNKYNKINKKVTRENYRDTDSFALTFCALHKNVNVTIVVAFLLVKFCITRKGGF